ncbi:MAG TPA: secondary thiamine-phosphate synthase enzyme YjbQ [Puia sp.]|nr:secondary thiamine-phosphate synthase enzyme YjbQ [Puia sp.]
MIFFQYTLTLSERRRGFHLVTNEILRAAPGIRQIEKGLCQVFLQHTSASLAINENADPTVRTDFETFFNKTVPEDDPDYVHNAEGPDDMPAHLKSAILGCSVLIPRHARFAEPRHLAGYLSVRTPQPRGKTRPRHHVLGRVTLGSFLHNLAHPRAVTLVIRRQSIENNASIYRRKLAIRIGMIFPQDAAEGSILEEAPGM